MFCTYDKQFYYHMIFRKNSKASGLHCYKKEGPMHNFFFFYATLILNKLNDSINNRYITLSFICTDCSLGVNISPLENILSCNLQESCSAVDCCVDIYLLERSFNVKFNLDPCSSTLELSIERLHFDVSLDDYVSGTYRKLVQIHETYHINSLSHFFIILSSNIII
jgi:hypothetical protein